MIVSIVILSFVLPMGSLKQAVQPAYQNNAFFQGFLEKFDACLVKKKQRAPSLL
ncbi:hypothetical protein [Oenococcus oeni]|uniref:hypothetical protein n=1 Tax=Oenococcus oeni TaxID=1247 RepID=UPI001FB4D3AA|nr:hypothetical protein [Oenococcus oeni]